MLRCIPEMNPPVPPFVKGGLGGISSNPQLKFGRSIPPAHHFARGQSGKAIFGIALNRLGMALACWLCLVSAAQADVRNHIRVVLDLSLSMVRNDPGKMAILSTLLLYDLAQPNPTQGDSFKVIPFKQQGWDWTKAIPTANGPVIEVDSLNRKPFADKVKALVYNATRTHFYPGIREAVADLEKTPKGDTRTIVLVTDGVPEQKTQDQEAERIQKEMLPLIEQGGIRLYVLAFSKEATQHKDFFEKLTKSDSLGKSFFDEKGDHLLEGMLELFATSLGYDGEPPKPLPQTASLQLSLGGKLPKAAVVVLRPGATGFPSLRLNPLPNQPVPVSDSTAGAAYTLAWVLSPSVGPYQLTTDAVQGSVAVLRPVQVHLDVRRDPKRPGVNINRTMAKTSLPLALEVNAEYGGNPGDVNVKYWLHGPGSQVDKLPNAPPGGGYRVPAMTGNVYDMPVKFPENNPPGKPYHGSVTVEASRGAKTVGELASPHSVDVYPFLAITPYPRQVDADPQGSTLQKGDKRCLNFELKLDAGELPENPPYAVRAVLRPANAKTMDYELRKSSFTLDGYPLQAENLSGAMAGEWQKGRQLDREALLGKSHELCIKIGDAKFSQAVVPVDLPVHLILGKSPYDDFDVIAPLTVRIKLASSPLDWRQWLLPAMAMLALALLWYLRDRPALPADLGYAITPDTPSASLVSKAFPSDFVRTHLLGLRAEKPIIPDSATHPAAWLRPVRGELYQLRLAQGVRLATADTGESTVLPRNRLATVTVQRTYRLHTPTGIYLIRLEYR